MQQSDFAFLIPADRTTLRRTGDGEIAMSVAGDEPRTLGLVAMAFPISRPEQLVALYDVNGDEIGILDDLDRLDGGSARLLAAELGKSYFMPRITRVMSIEEKLGVVTWHVHTDRGEREFEVRNVRRNTRRIGRYRVIIRDVDGNRYEIVNWTEIASETDALIEHFI